MKRYEDWKKHSYAPKTAINYNYMHCLNEMRYYLTHVIDLRTEIIIERHCQWK